MTLEIPTPFLVIILLISSLIILRKLRSSSKSKSKPNHGLKSDVDAELPPGPKRLPLIGNLHQMAGALPHHSLAKLAKKHGPIMHLQLGEMTTVIISSPDVAKDILKDHELSFAQRPEITALEVMSYENSSFIFSKYGDYWRQMRKIVVLELLSTKRVTSFRSIREQETWNMVKNISSVSSTGKPLNLSKSILSLINDMTSRSAFGERCKYQDEFISFLKEVTALGGGFELPDLFPSIGILRYLSWQKQAWVRLHRQIDRILEHIIEDHKGKLKTNGEVDAREDLVDVLLKLQQTSELKFFITVDVIKNVIMEMFSAGTDTSSTTIEWAMSELIKNPRVMTKAQAEIRNALAGKTRIQEADIQNIDYLKNVVKEILRLHPPGPLMAREAREECTIKGYRIPHKAKVVVNLSVLGRDPRYWSDPNSFKPERFEESNIDFRGGNFEFIPFGGGRRICPGINFGLANIELPLAQLLYHFDWATADGKSPEALDMTESFGITSRRKNNLVLIPRTVIALSG